ncbi:MAG: sel1 repeat family protein [Candidatus Melainabacteria bacterium]|nr:sel1 repeat family protein [Candidatus Melainabacteria bacterium]
MGKNADDPQEMHMTPRAVAASREAMDLLRVIEFGADKIESQGQGSNDLDQIERDLARALQLLEESFDQGFIGAAYNLGSIYLNGLKRVKGNKYVELPRNQARALEWFTRGAEGGDLDSQFTLAYMYDRGLGMPDSDLERARHWYLKAAEGGLGRAQYDMACIYLYGRGVPVDEALALTWFEKALASGVPRARAHVEALTGKAQA